MEEAEESFSTTVCYSFDKLKKACNSHGGARPLSFASPQEWIDLAEALSSTKDHLRFWLDLHQTVEKEHSDDLYIRNMYINTWQWGSGSVAYYLHGSIHQDVCDCAIALIRNYRVRSGQVMTKTHKCARVTAFDETEKPFPMPLCKAPTLPSKRDSAGRKDKDDNANANDDDDDDDDDEEENDEGIVIDPDAANHNNNNNNVSTSPVPGLVTCPSRHVTHASLACDPLSLCEGPR
ncbi:uncharacterized protein LOC143277794 [Babylonia areolata]|uniref:uncharacterized protein LOC143277794 n=1 Tax=Babylonia areolata TaxID=304850 RepID=UPI003FCFF9C3